jgi:peptide/nickel transport system permease protein
MNQRSFALLLVLAILFIFPAFAPYEPLQAVGPALSPPSAAHWFGTDLYGRDVFSRVLHGGWRTASMAGGATLLALAGALLVGCIATLLGPWADFITRSLTEALLAIPSLLIALVAVALFGNGPIPLTLAMAIALFPPYARVARAVLRQAQIHPHIEAARALGGRPWHIWRWHVLPIAWTEIAAFGLVIFGWAALGIGVLSFLGFGGDPAVPEWGAMLADARASYRLGIWTALAPGCAFLLLLLLVQSQENGPPRR